MKTFKQMNEDIQHQKQLNEKGLLKRIGQAKAAAVASFKSDPEKHAKKMKNIANRAKAQDAEHEKAKAALRDKSKSHAKELAGLKGAAKGYNISKKGSADNPNSMRPKDKDGNPKSGSFFDTTAEHNPNNKGSMAPHPKGDWVDAAGNPGKHTTIAHRSNHLGPSWVSATENRLNDPADKERKRYHGNNEAEDRAITIKKHLAALKRHAPEAKERIAHAEHTLKLHHDAHKAAGAHLETHGEHEFTTSNYGHYHEHHYGNGEEDHHYDEMEKHKKAEQKNPSETHIDNARLGYDHTHHDHPHHEEVAKADVADIPKHAATFHKFAKTATTAHHAYNKMVDSQKKAETDLPKGTKSKTALNKKAAYNKVDVKKKSDNYKKAIASVNPEHDKIIKNLKHVNKENRQGDLFK